MLGEGLPGVKGVSDRPYIAWGDCCYSAQIAVIGGVGAGDDSPLSAVPVLHQGGQPIRPTAVISNRPHVCRRDSGYVIKFIVVRTGIWAGDNAPLGAVPMLG